MEKPHRLINCIQKTTRTGRLTAIVFPAILFIGCASTPSPLHQAAKAGQVEQVKALVEAGADIDKLDRLGTPLVVAIRSDNDSISRYLIDRGANVNTHAPSTPLYFAAVRQQETIVKALLEKGAKINDQDPDGDTALHGGVTGGSVPVVSLLIRAGAAVNPVNKAGCTPLNLAAGRTYDLQPRTTARLLLDAGATANVVEKIPAITGKTLGIYASYLREKGKANEAKTMYLLAKEYLEKGVQQARQQQKKADQGAFWAEVFEPSDGLVLPGLAGATQRNIMAGTGTLVAGGRSSSEFEALTSDAVREEARLKVRIVECEDLIEAIDRGLGPDDATAYNKMGREHSKKGEYDLAIADYSKAIAAHPKYAVAYWNRAYAYGKQGEHDGAIEDYSRVLELNPSDVLAYRTRGNTYLRIGKEDLAAADYSKAIGLNPKDHVAYNNLGIVHLAKGEYDLALADFSKAVELDQHYALAYRNRGDTYRMIYEEDLAVADYSKAIGLNPKDHVAYNNLGVVHLAKGEYDLAVADFSKAVELDQTYALAYRNRADAYEKLNKKKLATADRSKAKALQGKQGR